LCTGGFFGGFFGVSLLQPNVRNSPMLKIITKATYFFIGSPFLDCLGDRVRMAGNRPAHAEHQDTNHSVIIPYPLAPENEKTAMARFFSAPRAAQHHLSLTIAAGFILTDRSYPTFFANI
jgi:hypothetical protein